MLAQCQVGDICRYKQPDRRCPYGPASLNVHSYISCSQERGKCVRKSEMTNERNVYNYIIAVVE